MLSLSLSGSVPLLTFCALPQLRFRSSPHLLRSLSFSHPLLTFLRSPSFPAPLLIFCALLIFGSSPHFLRPLPLSPFWAPLLTFLRSPLIFGSSPHFLRSPHFRLLSSLFALSFSLTLRAGPAPRGPATPQNGPRGPAELPDSGVFSFSLSSPPSA